MGSISALDEKFRRKFYVDDPDDFRQGQKLVFLHCLHGGGSVGAWQRAYFPAYLYRKSIDWLSRHRHLPPKSQCDAG